MRLVCFSILIILMPDFSWGQTSDENLLLYLPFDNNLNDISGYNHTVTKYGTSFVADRNGNPNAAIFFDGTDDYIDIANNAALNFGFSDFTISFWLKYPSQLGGNSPSAPGRIFDYATIFIKAANPNYPYEGITFFVDHKKHGDINFRTSNPHDLNITTNLNNNTWHHYVLRRKDQELSVFIDGELTGTAIYPVDNTSNNAGIRLGANHVDVLSQNYEGALDELKIYGRAIDEDEINPEIAINGTQFLCSGNELLLTATNGFDSYSWSTNESTQSIIVNKGGTYWVHGSKGAMTATDSIKITERACYIPAIETSFCHPLSFILQGPEGYDSYSWNTGETTGNIKITQKGWYILEANYNGYKMKDSVYIDSKMCFNGKIPNVITPNGDGYNETFIIPESLSGAELTVYNRWGAQVFYTPYYNNNWSAEGHKPGIFYFMLALKELKFSYKGWVHVLK